MCIQICLPPEPPSHPSPSSSLIFQFFLLEICVHGEPLTFFLGQNSSVVESSQGELKWFESMIMWSGDNATSNSVVGKLSVYLKIILELF